MFDCKCHCNDNFSLSECESILNRIEEGTFDAKAYFTDKKAKMASAIEKAKEEDRLRAIVNKLIDERMGDLVDDFEEDDEPEDKKCSCHTYGPIPLQDIESFLKGFRK